MERNPLRRESASTNQDSIERMDITLAANGATILEKGAPSAVPELELGRFGEFPPGVEKGIRLLAVFASDFLKGPIILDPFGDAEIDPWKRRTWRADLIQEYGDGMKDLLELNRMKPNRMTPFLSQAQRLQEKLQKSPVRSLALQQLEVQLTSALAPFEPLDDFGTRYIHLPLAERIEAAKSLSESARRLLALLEGQDTFQQREAA